MGYEGYLLKMSNPDSQNEEIEIPHKYMQYDSFKTKVNTQDLDSYQDSEGYLHRTVLENGMEFPRMRQYIFARTTQHFPKHLG